MTANPVRRLITHIAIGAAMAAGAAPLAFAHGEAKPKHAGVVRSAHHLDFELAATPAGATVYVEDHGKPYPVAGTTGKLTVLRAGQNGQKLEAALQPGQSNELLAPGISLASGDRAVVVMTTSAKKTISVRFVIP